jgi:hypothetical protein
MNPDPYSTLRAALAQFLRVSRDAYPTPQDQADGLLKCLAMRGYAIVETSTVKAEEPIA